RLITAMLMTPAAQLPGVRSGVCCAGFACTEGATGRVQAARAASCFACQGVQVARVGLRRFTPDKREVGGSPPPRPTCSTEPRPVARDRAGFVLSGVEP